MKRLIDWIDRRFPGMGDKTINGLVSLISLVLIVAFIAFALWVGQWWSPGWLGRLLDSILG